MAVNLSNELLPQVANWASDQAAEVQIISTQLSGVKLNSIVQALQRFAFVMRLYANAKGSMNSSNSSSDCLLHPLLIN